MSAAEVTPGARCPGCGTAHLTHGRTSCQACAVGGILASGLVPPATVALDAASARGRLADLAEALEPRPAKDLSGTRPCANCGTEPCGPGGVLCPGCKHTLTARCIPGSAA